MARISDNGTNVLRPYPGEKTTFDRLGGGKGNKGNLHIMA
jgi:hypothetical protein